jgi:hypothetical protein
MDHQAQASIVPRHFLAPHRQTYFAFSASVSGSSLTKP